MVKPAFQIRHFVLLTFFSLLFFAKILNAQETDYNVKKKKFGLTMAIEPGVTFCFQDKVETNAYIGKGTPFADPHFGLMIKSSFKKLMVEAGLTLHSYSVGYSIADPEVQTKHFSNSMSDNTGYRNYQLRLCYEILSLKKWFSVEPYVGSVLLICRKNGFFAAGSGNGTSLSPSDTIYYSADWRAYNLGRNFLVPMIGLKSKFNFKKSTVYLSSEFIWSEQYWRSTEVRYFRTSFVSGSIIGQGVVYSKIKNLSFSIGYAYKLF